MNMAFVDDHPRSASLKGKNVVIKFGGSSIDPEGLERFGADIALLVSLGIRPIVVHGGGPEISEEMNRRGLPVKKVMGLRITDDGTLEVAKGVLARINDQLVRAIQAKGVSSMGMSGAECSTIVCRKMPPMVGKDGEGKDISADLGWVGDIVKVDPKAISTMVGKNIVPVIYPICSDESGQFMNVNADTAAARVAMAVKAEELVLVTDVPGLMKVFGDPSTVISQIRTEEFEGLVRDGVVKEGMIPKLEACVMAVRDGVRAAHMIDGKDRDAIKAQLLTNTNRGTKIIR
ncbi:MAG: acetylglutamate kinase [Euryarchaeota archaeon]|nr:acetylglutamate kinase [Euryarchaeota archaeon]